MLRSAELAVRVGVDQSTISKIERGKQGISSIRQVALWCDAAGASEERRLELLALAEDVLVGPRSWADASATGSTDFQRETQELEARTGGC
jgi:transcriptional regulator with XRE-family HTH domain